MPTPSNSTHGDILPSDVPAEIRELYLSSHCPPEYEPTDSTPQRSLAQDLPTPPQDTPSIPPLSDERTRRNGQSTTRSVPDNTGLPHGLYFQEPHRMMDGIHLATGPADGVHGLRQRPSPRQRSSVDEQRHAANEGGSAVEQLEHLRLLEDARADIHPATMEYLRRRRQEVLRSPGGEARADRIDYNRLLAAQREALRRRNSRPDTWRQGLAPQLGDTPVNQRPQVRWPPTQAGQTTESEATRARLFGSQAPPASRSGPTSVDEELLRRAYRALQEPHALERYQATPESSERTTRNRRQPSWIGHHTPLSTYDDHILGSSPVNDPPRLEARLLSGPGGGTDHHGASLANHVNAPRTLSAGSAQPRADPRHEQEHESSLPQTAAETVSKQESRSATAPTNQFIPKPTLGIYTPHRLYPGAVFTGTQHSDQRKYPLTVVLKYVDFTKSFLCGHLTIDNLTDNHPRLETYFEAEIIGSRYRFPTRHPTWGASERHDIQHWRNFPPWQSLMRSQVEAAQSSSKSRSGSSAPKHTGTTTAGRTISDRETAAVWEKPIPNWSERDYIFMRWKEYFLVPDHKVTNISGASFEGFYYICYDVEHGTFHGIYYHAKSERWQSLELHYAIKPDKGCRGATELC